MGRGGESQDISRIIFLAEAAIKRLHARFSYHIHTQQGLGMSCECEDRLSDYLKVVAPDFGVSKGRPQPHGHECLPAGPFPIGA